jgi:ABC-2 type transport system permease protein
VRAPTGAEGEASLASTLVRSAPRPEVLARPAGFARDLWAVALRALRQIPRDPVPTATALVVPLFFYVLNVGELSKVTRLAAGLDFKAFELPVAVVFAVTGVSRASALVVDIQSGYFDRLCVTPARRLALLLGLMVADLVLVMALAVPVLGLGLAYGVRLETGLAGMAAFVALSGAWGLAFTGLPYSVALKTGNPAAVNASFVAVFPVTFLTTAFVPRQALAGWLGVAARYNPVTYVLAALRSLITAGWRPVAIAEGCLAIACVGCVTVGLALLALRGRTSRR